MAEYCLDCFIKQNPDIPKEKLVIAKDDDLDLCEGCSQMKPTVIRFKRDIYKTIRWFFRRLKYVP